MKGKHQNDPQRKDAAVYIISMLVVVSISGTVYFILLIQGVIK